MLFVCNGGIAKPFYANNLLNANIRNSTSYLRHFTARKPGRGAEIGFRVSYFFHLTLKTCKSKITEFLAG